MYNAHFKFREAPFGVTPDPQFYYTNAVYREALATLCYGIEARKGFIVVAGEVGTGKTTLLRKAMRSFESNIKVAYLCNTLVSFTELLRLILHDLGLPVSTNDKLTMISQLNEYLIEQLTAGNVVALLIDEAQDLSPEILEELRLLGNLETDKDKLLQMVLIGQPELERKLDQANLRQLKQRIALRCRLEPIGADEVGPYIDSRLQTIGHRCEELFDAEAVKKIALSSKGIPRLINIICDNALVIAYAMAEYKVCATMIDEVTNDLLINRTPTEREIWVRTLIRPAAKMDEAGAAHEEKGDLKTIEELIETESDNLAAHMDHPAIASAKDESHLRLSIGALMFVVMLTVLSVFFYSENRGKTALELASPNESPVGNGSKEIKHANLRVATVDEISSRTIPQTTTLSEPSTPEPIEKNNADTKPSLAAASKIPAANQHVGTAPLGTNGPIYVRANSLNQQKIAAGPTLGDKQSENSSPRRDDKEKTPGTGDFDVVAASFVRGKPTSNADIIATLEPGSHVNVSGRTGDYYRVRTLGNEIIYGYVHREDAFFEKPK